MRYATLLTIIALLAGCASRSTVPAFSELPDSNPPADPDEAILSRHIMPGDRFPVWIALGTDSPVRVDLTVDQEGCVQLPQIGRLHVAGMLGTEMEEAVIAEYQRRGIPLHGGAPANR